MTPGRSFVLAVSVCLAGTAVVGASQTRHHLRLHQQAAASVICPADKHLRPLSDDKPTLLYSMEGSGNTMMRLLLENATGIYTGAIYTDGVLRKKGFKEGVTDSSVLFVKSHALRAPSVNPGKGSVYHYANVVHLMRHPLDAFVAERKRRITDNHRKSPPWEAFVQGLKGGRRASLVHDTALSWDDWLNHYGSRLWNHTLSIRQRYEHQAELNVLDVKFENVIKSPAAELKRVFEFVGVNPLLAQCVQTHDAEKVKREGSASAYPDCVYTRDQLEVFLHTHGRTLRELGYPPVPPQCAPVLIGHDLGGTDASPVSSV